jgi:RND family efflux transporter MFP subunit
MVSPRVLATYVLLAVSLVFLGCEKKQNIKVAAPPIEKVTVASPIQKEVIPYWTYTGTLDGFETVEIRPRVNGFLDEIAYKAGDMVKNGQHLFTVDPRPYDAAVKAAQADLEAKKALLAQAQFNLEKIAELMKKQASSQYELVNQTAVRDQAKGNYDASLAQLETAKLNLGYTNVSSPVTGVISRNMVDRGALVGPTSLLATVVDQAKIYAYFNMSESDLLKILESHEMKKPLRELIPSERPKVEIARSGETSYNYIGLLDSADNKVSSGTGTITLRALFENPTNELLPGMFVRVRIPDDPKKAILIPQVALSSDQAGQFVLALDKDNVVQRRYVELGLAEGTLREVTKGLALEDRIVVNGLQRARPGAKVDPVTDGAAPATPAPAPATAPAPKK